MTMPLRRFPFEQTFDTAPVELHVKHACRWLNRQSTGKEKKTVSMQFLLPGASLCGRSPGPPAPLPSCTPNYHPLCTPPPPFVPSHSQISRNRRVSFKCRSTTSRPALLVCNATCATTPLRQQPPHYIWPCEPMSPSFQKWMCEVTRVTRRW